MKKFDLTTFRNGALVEMFNEEMEKVLANIEDENTEAKKERTVTLRVKIVPGKTRRDAAVYLSADSTLAKFKPVESLLFFDRDDAGRFSAYDDFPGQQLPGMEGEEAGNITAFPKTGTGGR